jgi:hypothetical protein
MCPDHSPFALWVLGITGATVAFQQSYHAATIANLLRRCRRAVAVGSLTTIQFGSGDRSFPIRIGGLARGEFPLNSDRHLRQTIDGLRKLERKCFAARSRFAFYDYLAAVFELYVQLRRRNQAKPLVRRIAQLFGLRNQDRTHPIRVIIATRPRPQISRPGGRISLSTEPLKCVSSSARPQAGGKGGVIAIGEVLKCYVEFHCLDHEDIAQGFRFDSCVRIGPRAPKTLVRLFKPIVWSRSIWPVYHELMPDALPVPR